MNALDVVYCRTDECDVESQEDTGLCQVHLEAEIMGSVVVPLSASGVDPSRSGKYTTTCPRPECTAAPGYACLTKHGTVYEEGHSGRNLQEPRKPRRRWISPRRRHIPREVAEECPSDADGLGMALWLIRMSAGSANAQRFLDAAKGAYDRLNPQDSTGNQPGKKD